MMFDATIHLGDVIALGSIGLVAWQRVSSTLRSLDRFMEDSREDRLALHRRLDLVEQRLATQRAGRKHDAL